MGDDNQEQASFQLSRKDSNVYMGNANQKQEKFTVPILRKI